MKTLVYAEHDNASLKDATLAVVTAASQIGEVHVLVAGSGCGAVAEQAGTFSAELNSRKIELQRDPVPRTSPGCPPSNRAKGRPLARARLSTCKPSRPGRLRSSSTTSGCACCQAARASAPSAHSSTRMALRSRLRCSVVASVGSSSIKSRRMRCVGWGLENGFGFGFPLGFRTAN